VEVLKQPQYEPMPVEQQVMTIYAVTNGFLDDVAVERIQEWEHGFHAFMAAQYPQVGQKIRTDKVLSKETEEELKRGTQAYKATPAGAPARAQGAAAAGAQGGPARELAGAAR
jgi:F-type H+-transporting ATPase subunit alpha